MVINLAYLFSATGLIFGLKLMGSSAQAKNGNLLAAIAVGVALLATFFHFKGLEAAPLNLLVLFAMLILGTVIGKIVANKAQMTEMPQLVSLFNAFGGACAILVGLHELVGKETIQLSELSLISIFLGVVLGGISFTGSLIAYYKLNGVRFSVSASFSKTLSRILLLAIFVGLVVPFGISLNPIQLTGLLIALTLAALLYGFSFTIAIGGADMPVLISFLNAITGVAAAFSGIVFASPVMLIGGILVGATGVILTMQMCKAMNRSLFNILSGKFANNASLKSGTQRQIEYQDISVVETASLLLYAKKVAIIPGYGLAVSQAQQACYELHKQLLARQISIDYIIHPVAGRMPGHMNVLLAEAKIEYDYLREMDDANPEMDQYDVCIVIGANDVVNPSAENDANCSIYGMPIIKAYNSKRVIVMKRGMAAGYSGEQNSLFERPNCNLLFGDANTSLQKILSELKHV